MSIVSAKFSNPASIYKLNLHMQGESFLIEEASSGIKVITSSLGGNQVKDALHLKMMSSKFHIHATHH